MNQGDRLDLLLGLMRHEFTRGMIWGGATVIFILIAIKIIFGL